MKFLDKNFQEISKSEANLSVLRIFGGKYDGCYIDYKKIKSETLKQINANKVILYVNHAGNDSCSISLMHSESVAKKVSQLNKALTA